MGADPGDTRGARPDLPAAPAPPPVALHRWDGHGEPPAATPIDAYSLRLVAGHALYGADAVVAATPHLAAFMDEPTLGISARDRDRLGVADGTRVRVTSARGWWTSRSAPTLTSRAGTVFIAVNVTGPGAPDLIHVAATVTDLRVESIS